MGRGVKEGPQLHTYPEGSSGSGSPALRQGSLKSWLKELGSIFATSGRRAAVRGRGMVKDTPGRQQTGTIKQEGSRQPALPLAVPQVGCCPRQPRRCLRSGQGSPPCRGGTVTWRLRALLPTPHGELHPLHGPQGPTAQPTAAREGGEGRVSVSGTAERAEQGRCSTGDRERGGKARPE